MKGYWEELVKFLKNKALMVCVALLAVIAYGFAAMNGTLSVDDVEQDRYVGPGMEMIRAGRIGTMLWHFLQGGWQSPGFMDILAVLLMILSACSCCVLLKKASQNRIGMPALAVFIGMIVTYPLILDVWEYTGTNVSIFCAFLCATWAAALMYGQIHEGNWRKPWRPILASLLMLLVCTSYESVVTVYIFLVCAMLALQVAYGTLKGKKLWEVLRQGLLYAGVLAVGLLLRLLVHGLLMAMLGLEPVVNGRTAIVWGTKPVVSIIKQLVLEMVRYYVLNGIIYYPIGLMLTAVVVFVVIGIVACKKYGATVLLPGVGMLLSLVALSLLQGTRSAYRSCQVFGVFCAFTLMLAVHCLSGKKRWVRTGALILCSWLMLYQASYISHFLALNYHRSEQEARTVHQIGIDLQREADPNKPVLFVGQYTLDDEILEAASLPEDSLRWQTFKYLGELGYRLAGRDVSALKWDRTLPETNVWSVINWAIKAYDQTSMKKLFAYYGFNIVSGDFAKYYDSALEYAEETNMPAYPREGYIEDMGEYVLVHLE